MIILHERAVILLTKPKVSALRIKTLAKNNFFNRAPRITVSDKDVKCKQLLLLLLLLLARETTPKVNCIQH